MSHLAFSNLAKVDNFSERHLNYTGITLEGWWHGPNIVTHLALLIVVLLTGGLPRKGCWLEGIWLLINIIIIHPMDL